MPIRNNLEKEDVLRILELESYYQDLKHGGAEHDVLHGEPGFLLFIEYQLEKAKYSYYHGSSIDFLKAVIIIMTLAYKMLVTFNYASIINPTKWRSEDIVKL